MTGSAIRGTAKFQPACGLLLQPRTLGLWLALLFPCAGLLHVRDIRADDVPDAVPPQLKAAQETALQWWRHPDNRVTVARSTHTASDGTQQLRVVFILRDPQGRPLACARADGEELQAYWRKQLSLRLNRLQQDHPLDGDDINKLTLAADVDIARFLRRVREAEQMLITNEVRQDPSRINQLLSPIEADCKKEGLFNDRSLYSRVLATILAQR